jgi:hypothetical protein
MKSILFFVVIIGIAITLYVVTLQPVEGFQGQELAVPLAGPPVAQITSGDPKAFAPPSATLLAPPPGQTASVNSQPYEDPAMQKASADSLNNAYVSVKGFLTNEAPNMQAMSDPSIQLPLSTARSDANRLQDELAVLKRNPGLESSLTVEDLNGIEANLGYLQRKWRLSANSPTSLEGFECGCKAGSMFGWGGSVQEGFEGGDVDTAANPSSNIAATIANAAATVVASSNPSTDPVSLNDLKDLSDRIGVEVVRLSASGTTDPLVQARVNTLNNVQNSVNDIISEVETGNRSISDVPLTKEYIATFLPIMSNLNNPIPQIAAEKAGNPALQNLAQSYMGGDKEAAKAAQELFDKYAAKILKNLSWKFDITYTGEAEQEMSKAEVQAIQGLLSAVAGPGPGAAPVGSSYPGFFNVVTQKLGNGPMAKPAGAAGSGGAASPSGPVSNFDWKTRATQICQQVAARGMKPSDFGCVADPKSVGDNFSWRGHAKMVCNRIATLFDPSIPEACGCPPASWDGWKS